MGLAAFSGSLRGLEWFRQSGVISSHPPVHRRKHAGHNASRWAAHSKFWDGAFVLGIIAGDDHEPSLGFLILNEIKCENDFGLV